MIPYARHFTTKVTGSCMVSTSCENCQTEYVYRLERSVTGDSTSLLFIDEAGAEARAFRRAEANLQSRLSRDFDAVPCPQCGWYQSHMQPVVRRNYHRWMRIFGLIALAACGVLFLVYYLATWSESLTDQRLRLMSNCVSWGSICGVVAAVLLVGKLIISGRYDPNNAGQVDLRLRLAKARVVPKEELEKLARQT